MTLARQDGLALECRGASTARICLRTPCPRPSTFAAEEDHPVASGWHEPAGYLLAWTAALVFCSGLIALAVSGLFDVSVPRWLILAHGGDGAVLALLAGWLTRPWQSSLSRSQIKEFNDEFTK
jgi:hypothetical protein